MPEPRSVAYRPMTDADLSAARLVQHLAIGDLNRQQNRPQRPFTPFIWGGQRMILRLNPACCWVAEIGGVLMGYAMAIVRGRVWFLSQLFVHPDTQGQDIGRELLRRSQDAGRSAGSTVFAVVASSSLAAQALYTRAGMAARGLLYHMEGTAESLLMLPEPRGAPKKIVDCDGWQEALARIDRKVWSEERRSEHAMFVSGESAFPGGEDGALALSRDGAIAGYVYPYTQREGDDLTGGIAPLAAIDPVDQLPLLRMAAEWLTERGVKGAEAPVLSANQLVIGTLLQRGWTIKSSNTLMSSEAFGQPDRFLPAGGGLL